MWTITGIKNDLIDYLVIFWGAAMHFEHMNWQNSFKQELIVRRACYCTISANVTIQAFKCLSI